jgi:hypothetical protein
MQRDLARGDVPDKVLRKNKKPGTAGLLDEFRFRSVHLASLAI